MKKIALLTTVFLGLTFYSCSNNDSLIEPSENEAPISIKSNNTFLTSGFSSKNIELNELSTFINKVENFGIYKDVSTQQVIIDKDDFYAFLADFKEYYNFNLSENRVRGIIFYGDNVNINLNDFRNVTLITLDEDGYAKFISYEKQNTNLTLMDNNPQRHSFIMMNYLGYLGTSLDLSNSSMLTVINDEDFGLSVDNEIATNLLPQNIDRTVLAEYKIIPYSYTMTATTYCNMNDCDSNARGYCAVTPQSAPHVVCNAVTGSVNDVCVDDEADGRYKDHVIAPYGYKSAMYAIRDNFLLKSEKGKEYVDFYYKISFCFQTLDIYDEKEDELIDLVGKIRSKSLDYLVASDKDIIINNNDYTYLKDMIDDFKTVSDNEEYQYIFNKMESDLNFLKNKTKSELKTYFND